MLEEKANYSQNRPAHTLWALQAHLAPPETWTIQAVSYANRTYWTESEKPVFPILVLPLP